MNNGGNVFIISAILMIPIIWILSHIKIKKIRIEYDKGDTDEFIKELRKKDFMIDIKCQIYNCLSEIKKEFQHMKEYASEYSVIIAMLGLGNILSEILKKASASYADVSSYLKRGRLFYNRIYRTNDYDRVKTMHFLVDEHLDNFKNLFILSSSLKEAREKLKDCFEDIDDGRARQD